jgi:hypothetical protein
MPYGIQEIVQDISWFLAKIFKYISISVMEIQFCVLCSTVRYLFKALNLELKSYIKTERVTNKRMIELQDCYNNLIQVTVYINDLYGMCNLLNMAMLNIYVQTDVYGLIKYFYDNITHKHQNNFDATVFAWTLTDFYKCVMYFEESSNTVTEVIIELVATMKILNITRIFSINARLAIA